jgi:Tol biopolymer transport system component
VPGDTNGAWDIFVHDRKTGETTRVSADSAGNQGNADSSNKPAISADGRYVAFQSRASNLVPGDTSNAADVFVHDRQTGETTRVSVDSAGNQGNADSHFPAISADGRYVAFQSLASNLVPGDTNNAADVFVYDRQTGETTRVSVDSAGNQGSIQSGSPSSSESIGSAGSSVVVAIGGDGRYLAFASDEFNLVPGDTNGYPDVFVYDRGAAVGGMPESANPSGSRSLTYIVIACLAGVIVLAVAAGAWYVRRRWLR